MTDTRTLIGPLGIWGLLSSLPATELRPTVARVSALGYGAQRMHAFAGGDEHVTAGGAGDFSRRHLGLHAAT